jgi:hypothetical protein
MLNAARVCRVEGRFYRSNHSATGMYRKFDCRVPRGALAGRGWLTKAGPTFRIFAVPLPEFLQ